MRDNVLWRKQSHIILLLADYLQIDIERALDLFYSTKTYQLLSDPRYGLQLMSDQYLLENVLEELREDATKEISLFEHTIEYPTPEMVTGCVAEDSEGYNEDESESRQ